MHVQPFEPCWSVRVSIFSFIAMTVALFETAAGAAALALRTISSSVVGGVTGPEAGVAAVVLVLAGGFAGAGGSFAHPVKPTARTIAMIVRPVMSDLLKDDSKPFDGESDRNSNA
jgi:hypothetical protein